jgi:hypothetical protein
LRTAFLRCLQDVKRRTRECEGLQGLRVSTFPLQNVPEPWYTTSLDMVLAARIGVKSAIVAIKVPWYGSNRIVLSPLRRGRQGMGTLSDCGCSVGGAAAGRQVDVRAGPVDAQGVRAASTSFCHSTPGAPAQGRAHRATFPSSKSLFYQRAPVWPLLASCATWRQPRHQCPLGGCRGFPSWAHARAASRSRCSGLPQWQPAAARVGHAGLVGF